MTVRRIPLTEAREKLGEIIDDIYYDGQSVAITRRGRVVARLYPERADAAIPDPEPEVVAA